MSYSHICPNCGAGSEIGQSHCPVCGAEKELTLDGSSAEDLIYNEIDSQIPGIENPSVYIKIIISLVILLAGIFLLPDFIRNSELFWMIYIVSTIFTVIKAVDKYFSRLRGIYFIARILLWSYVGAGFANLISFTGTGLNYPFSYYFNPEFIFDQINGKNPLVLVGAFSTIVIFFLFRYYRKLALGKF